MTDGRPPMLIVLGPPGSGKSTQAARLAERLGLAHISPGALFREIAEEDSAIGRRIRDLISAGTLVPDDVTDDLVRDRINVVPPERGIVVDGYPRTVAQAEALRRMLAESGRLQPRPVVLRLDVPGHELADRLRRRRDLHRRRDDTDEVISRRLQTGDAETDRLVDAVADWADLVTINGAHPADAITTEIMETLDAIRKADADESHAVDAPVVARRG
jgi:adenylate kinase